MIDFNVLKKQFLVIYCAVKQYGDSTNNPQLAILEELLAELDKDNPDVKLLEELNHSLYPPYAGLSEFFIWDDDFDKRIELNNPVDNAKRITWEMLN
ncbi:hypothetical protein [Listeria sp. ILCC797]|uniref:hypothetical protein n=1 Tax=Listeria sp. ILCC797 TaxID=1918333 RepID=UPI000B5896B5|nr:hypothetical protein [Listeria sp. ILCC797]